MPKRIRIGTRWIGEHEPVFVIAEVGSNHNGRYEQALELIDVAVKAGADAVKFQVFRAKNMYPRSAGASDYLKTSESIYSMIEKMEMPEAWIPKLAAVCRERNIEFMATPFDEDSANLLQPYLNVVKIASYEMTHQPLLRHVASWGTPMILSTGTASLEEVTRVAAELRAWGNDQLVFCQCTACYPAPAEAVNVRAMIAMREATGCLVGFSDHSREPLIAPVLAVGLGACVIEKHVTLDNDLSGPDHRFAVEPDELMELVRAVRTAERMLGHGRKELLPQERELHAFARRSIFSTRPIRAGERLGRDAIAVLRCGKLGTGLAPARLDEVLGRVAARDLPAEHPIQNHDLA